MPTSEYTLVLSTAIVPKLAHVVIETALSIVYIYIDIYIYIHMFICLFQGWLPDTPCKHWVLYMYGVWHCVYHIRPDDLDGNSSSPQRAGAKRREW